MIMSLFLVIIIMAGCKEKKECIKSIPIKSVQGVPGTFLVEDSHYVVTYQDGTVEIIWNSIGIKPKCIKWKN
jgi:hypothetical protein